MRILIAGASGFLGTRLAKDLTDSGHSVLRLVRRTPHRRDEVRWDPGTGTLDPAVVSTVDVAVNLAGAGVGDRRWTDRYKHVIRASRVDTTSTLARAIANAERRPRVLLNASAVGWYGDTGDEPVDEDSPPGEGFLSDVCRVWEAATRPAEEVGVRTVHMRTGFPLSAHGGLLKPMLMPFRLGVGGKLGSGRQYMPWIAMTDWLRAVRFLLDHGSLTGPVNLTGPNPATNADFTRALARVLGRPAVLPVPTVALRAVLGDFATEALVSQRVVPAVLAREGFRFEYPDLEPALRAALAPEPHRERRGSR